jgi:hypothetical protein
MAMLKESEIEQMRDGEWRLDCPVMTLRNRVRKRDIYRGGGFIERAHDGRLSLTLYSPRGFDLRRLFRSTGPAGRAIPETEYYDLTARDTRARTWECNRILMAANGSDAGVVVTSNLHVLTCTEGRPVISAKPWLELVYLDDIEIPLNATSEVTTKVADQQKSKRFKANASLFTSCDCNFQITSAQGVARLSATTDKDLLPPHLDTRATEALRFVLAVPVQWAVLHKSEADTEVTQIRGTGRPSGRFAVYPPIRFTGPANAAHVWALFDRYLRHVIAYDKHDKYHPLSALVNQVFDANEASINAQALTLGVAVEGVLRRAFPKVVSLSEKEKKTLEEARVVVEHSPLDAKMKARILGQMANWSHPSASDVLHYFIREKLISKREHEAWKDLRHPSAHASLPSAEDIDKLVDLCSTVRGVFYKLIFRAVGYDGPHTDYHTRGWPLAKGFASHPKRARRGQGQAGSGSGLALVIIRAHSFLACSKLSRTV